MPIKRDSDGNIIEQPTRQENGVKDGDRRTEKYRQNEEKTAPVTDNASPYEAKTRLVRRGEQQTGANKVGEAHTRIYRPGRKTPAKSTQAATDTPPPRQPSVMDDPPVGWLVVIDGPGQGNVVTLGNGVNSIGRDSAERLSLDFGDEMISRSDHANITYDPRGKKFYIKHGGGTNLIYVNDQPVLSPQELPPHTHIMIGNTTLRFVPLSGKHFDWDTQEVN